MSLKTIVESCLVLEEGEASAKDIEIGMMMGAGILPGPFTRADDQGLDSVLEALERAQAEWGDGFEPPLVLKRLVAQGRLGKKSGQGFFPYPQPDDGQSRETIALETRGDVGIVWLNRPPANPLSPQVIRELTELWGEIDGKLRVVVFASSNVFTFSAGADIKEFTKMSPDKEGKELIDSGHAFMRGMEQSRTVTIAAVNSIAFGGGCELAMACDFRLAAESATFGQPEINLGIIPGFGGTQRLPRLVGEAKALEMNLVGDPIGAYEALRLGPGEPGGARPRAVRHRARVGARSWPARRRWRSSRSSGCRRTATWTRASRPRRQGFAAAFGSEDAKEGIGAFLGKRQPKFQGK